MAAIENACTAAEKALWNSISAVSNYAATKPSG